MSHDFNMKSTLFNNESGNVTLLTSNVHDDHYSAIYRQQTTLILTVPVDNMMKPSFSTIES